MLIWQPAFLVLVLTFQRKKMREFGFDDNFLSSMMEEDVEFLPLLSLEEDDDQIKIEYPETIAVMPLRNTVLFPGVVLPITVGREKSIKAIHKGEFKCGPGGCDSQIDKHNHLMIYPHPTDKSMTIIQCGYLGP